jgi:hypothetical protein
MDKNKFLYVLVDPRDSKVRYVGICVNPKARYSFHLGETDIQNIPKFRWITQLIKQDMLPIMRILKEVPSVNALEEEAKAIKFYARNSKLFNRECRNVRKDWLKTRNINLWAERDKAYQEIGKTLVRRNKQIQI